MRIKERLKKYKLMRNVYQLIKGNYLKLIEIFYNKPYDVKRKYILKKALDLNIKETFIETGTFLGDTVFALKDNFKNLISIELSVDLAKKANDRFINDSNIKIIQGDSAYVLESTLAGINNPILFWLDGHYSSEFFVGDQYIKTAKGEGVTPILKEIQIIIEHPIKKHCILIDDARLFTGDQGYPRIKDLKKLLKNSSYYLKGIKNDIISIQPIQIP